jgi:hypothetical protein
MGIEEVRARLDRDVRSLVGQRLVAVAYYEVDYSSDQPSWERDPEFDSLDFGLELRFEGGGTCWVSWGDVFYTYALKIEANNTWEDRGRMREWDSSRSSRWRSLLGLTIADAKVYWDWQQEGRRNPRKWAPQDLQLTFEGGAAVFISSLSIEPGSVPFGHTDTITVFFDPQVARRYEVGPFTRTPHTSPAGVSASGLIG